MINISDITKAVEEAFHIDPAYNGFVVERSEYVNENPQLAPWIGIYRGAINYSPETLGMGEDQWTGVMDLRLVVQAANMASGAAVEDELEGYVRQVIATIFNDTTLRGTIDMINRVNVTYSYIAEEEETMFFQAALIELTLEVSTS